MHQSVDYGGGEEGRTPLALRLLPLLLIAAGLGIGYALGWQHYLSLDYLAESRDALKAYVAGHYLLSVLGFGAVYFLATAFCFPAASILTIFGGFLFGWIVATAIVVVAATAGATALFLAARTAFGDALRRRVGPKVEKLASGFETNAFGYLLVLRLAPFFPFFVVNIAPALFRVRLATYVAATAIGILPGVAAYTYLGQGSDSVLGAARAAGSSVSVQDLVTPQIKIAFAALAAVAILAIVVKKVFLKAGR